MGYPKTPLGLLVVVSQSCHHIALVSLSGPEWCVPRCPPPPDMRPSPKYQEHEEEEEEKKTSAYIEAYSEQVKRFYNSVAKTKQRKALKPAQGGLTKAEIDELLPDGALGYVDPVNARTQVYLRPFRTFSRAWDLYSQRGAGLLCIKEAWRAHESKTGQGCPHPLVFTELDKLGLGGA